MTDIPELSTPPDAPSASDDAATFNAKSFPFAAYIEGLGLELNAYTAALNAWAATILQALFTATSTSNVTIAGSGSETFLVQAGKSFAQGQFILAARTSAPANYMRGQVSSYNSATGELIIAVAASGGGGAYSDWTISLIPDPATLAAYAQLAGAAFTGPVSVDALLTMKAYKETVYAITDGAAFEIDPANGSIQTITLGAARTPKATNFANGQIITLAVDDGTAYTLTWTDTTFGASGVKWVDGSVPVLATTGLTWIQLWKVDGQVYGALTGATS